MKKILIIIVILSMICMSSCTTGKTAVDTTQQTQKLIEEVKEEPKIEAPPEPYCGDNSCQEIETKYNCSKDCGEPYSFNQLTEDINAVFNDDWVFSEDKNSSTNEIKYYKSHRVTIGQIQDKEEYMYTYNNFRSIINKETKIAEDDWVKAAKNYSDENGYTFTHEQRNVEVDLGADKAIDSIYIFKYYKLYPVKDDVTDKWTNITHFDFPEVDEILKIWCTPEFFIKIRRDPNWGISVNWNNIKDVDLDPTINNYLSDSRDSSIDVTKEIINSCSAIK